MHSGIAGGADVILIPEIPYDLDRVVLKVRRRQAKKRYFSVIVVAEGATSVGQDPILLENEGPGGKKRRLGGAGAQIAEQVQAATGIDCRVTVLGHLQRGGTPLSSDRLLAARYGMAAMDMVEQDRWGTLVALQGREMIGLELSKAAGKIKQISAEDELVRVARSLGIELGA